LRVLAKLFNLAKAVFARGRRSALAAPSTLTLTSGPKAYQPLQRVVLADGVLRTLFDDFARHRQTARGEEEFGWALLGVRDECEAHALAALPAGAQRHASLTHIQFHSNAQAVATRLLRQRDKQLTMLGVVHTHPGSLRHPSSGDYRGDILFVTRLRGREGVFGIGTADTNGQSPETRQPAPNQHVRGPLCFHWYALAEGNDNYRAIPVVASNADDLARPLAGLWPTLETHADALENLSLQLAHISLDVVGAEADASLALAVALADDRRLRVLLQGSAARYYVESDGDLSAVEPGATAVDHGVYSILAELAKRRHVEQASRLL
jgi:hypothetical protein